FGDKISIWNDIFDVIPCPDLGGAKIDVSDHAKLVPHLDPVALSEFASKNDYETAYDIGRNMLETYAGTYSDPACKNHEDAQIKSYNPQRGEKPNSVKKIS